MKDNPKSWVLYRDKYSLYSTQLLGLYFTQLLVGYKEYYSTQVLGLYFIRTTRSRGNATLKVGCLIAPRYSGYNLALLQGIEEKKDNPKS